MPLPPARHREGDDDPESWRARTLHSLTKEEIEHFAAQIKGHGGGEMAGLDLSWGRAHIAAKGIAAIVLIMFVTQAAIVLYVGHRMETAIGTMQVASTEAIGKIQASAGAEHATARKTQDRMACLLSMSIEERTRFRMEFKPGAWQRWCGWMSED